MDVVLEAVTGVVLSTGLAWYMNGATPMEDGKRRLMIVGTAGAVMSVIFARYIKSTKRQDLPAAHWSCACGGVKFKMFGPPMTAYNCCCQSCDACANAIMAKGGNGTSWKAPESPGLAIALYEAIKVVPFKPDELASKVGYVKIEGAGGIMLRWYAKCCNTPIGNLGGPGNAGMNFNCITNPDGSKSPPPLGRDPKLLNIQAKFWSNPEAVPNPKKAEVRDLGFMMMVLPQIIKNKPWCPFTQKAHPSLLPNLAISNSAELVKDTWN